ncbi:PadR family transcriptional regulator, partial [Bacillus toyonensis]
MERGCSKRASSFCRYLLISRYPLSKRRYIEKIVDIFEVMIDIFEK